MVQDAVNRWWWPSLMMFGPHDSESTSIGRSSASGASSASATTICARSSSMPPCRRPRCSASRCLTPTCTMRTRRAGHWDFGAIDWAEFWNVVNGHGQCNRDRLADRVKAWEDGAWVREAALAHAEKQRRRDGSPHEEATHRF